MTVAQDVSTPRPDQPAASELPDLELAWKRWHITRQRDLAVPHGWLSLTHFQWLDESPAALPGLPGIFSTQGRDGATVAVAFADVSDGLRLAAGPQAGEAVHGEITAEVVEAGSLLWLRHGQVLVELVLRGGRYAVRVRDPQGRNLPRSRASRPSRSVRPGGCRRRSPHSTLCGRSPWTPLATICGKTSLPSVPSVSRSVGSRTR